MVTSLRRYPTQTLAAIMSIAGVLLAVLTVPQAVAEDAPSTAVIIDASGSMLAPDAGGQTRMDAAKQATEGLLNDLPKEQRLSLLTYGTQTGSGDEEKAAGCQDVTTLVPMGGNRAEMVSKVKGLNPRGYTPIGKSLLQAEKELPGQGGRQIVLVSDGIDTCAPPPVCEVAKQIRERGVDIVINVIGLNVDDQARSELQCVAKEGGGSYADAKDAASLKEQLVLKSTRNLQKYQSGGEQAHGAPTAAEARPIEAGGMKDRKPDPKHYQDVLPATTSKPASSLHWKVNLGKGERLGIGYIVPPPPTTGNSLGSYITVKADIKGPNDSTCVDKDKSASNPNEFYRSLGGAAISHAIGENSSCQPGDYNISLERTGSLEGQHDLPIELMLWKVPEAADATTTSAPPTDKPQPTNLEVGNSAGKLPSALGPSDAPTVKPGTYDAEIVPGEMLWFKVPVEEGQRLQMAFDVPPIDLEDPNDIYGRLGRKISWSVMGPTLYPVVTKDTKKDSIDNNDYSVDVYRDATATASTTTLPIRWDNINNSDSDVYSGFVSGEQYVALRYSTIFRKADQNTQSIPIKFRVAVAATGEAEKAPTLSYNGEQQSATASAATDSSSTSANADGGNSTGGILRTATRLALGGGAVGLVVLLLIGVVFITRRLR